MLQSTATIANNQITGNIGLYYACYKLSCLGWNVMPTARNARGVDIVAYDRTGSRYFGFQVKSLTKRNPVPLGKGVEALMGHFWIIIYEVRKDPEAFILTPADVRRLSHRTEKDERVAYWIEANAYDTPEFRDQWEQRIGRGD